MSPLGRALKVLLLKLWERLIDLDQLVPGIVANQVSEIQSYVLASQ